MFFLIVSGVCYVLKIFDARNVTTAEDIFAAILRHITYAASVEGVPSAMTVFRHRTTPEEDFRIWNAQLIKYAGYRQEDGSCIGDEGSAEFTEVCKRMINDRQGCFCFFVEIFSANLHWCQFRFVRNWDGMGAEGRSTFCRSLCRPLAVIHSFLKFPKSVSKKSSWNIQSKIFFLPRIFTIIE